MDKEIVLYKGERMEENLRDYFLRSGYYVVRGIKYKYKKFDITDVDLFLYGKNSSLSREKINVDIKNKKSPKALERILWTKGLQVLLNFDKCIVATTERKDEIREFAKLHDIILLDGSFLGKLKPVSTRLVEEDFLSLLAREHDERKLPIQTWRFLYESSKSSLLNDMTFSNFNKSLAQIKYFVTESMNSLHFKTGLRCLYVFLSHSLIILDYLLKDLAFLEQSAKEAILLDGFRYGNRGREGLKQTIALMSQLTRQKISINSFKEEFESVETESLRDYFSKNEVANNVFNFARQFEDLAFVKI